MSWRHENLTGTWTPWGHRRALTVECSAKTASPVDVSFVIPSAWDSFWENIDAAGAELRVCDADGSTLLSYDVTATGGGGFDRAARDGLIQVDGLAVTIDGGNARLRTIWLYYGLASAPDASSAVTIASASAAKMESGLPRSRVLNFGPEDVGATQPRARTAKTSGESIFVYLDVTDLLRRSSESMAGSLALEEVAEIGRTLDVKNGASSNPGMYDHAKNRVQEVAGRTFIRLYLTGGADGTDYTVTVPLITTNSQTFEARFVLKVRDVNED